MSTISDNIRNFRILRGFSQRTLADQLHKSPNTIANWEKGINSPDVEILDSMCKVLEITPNVLYGWEKSPELDEFLRLQKLNMEKMDLLIKQRSELDERIKEYAARIANARNNTNN